MARSVRLLGSLLVIAGVAALAWAFVVWRWEDPFTALYTSYEQHRLATSYEHRFASFHPPAFHPPIDRHAEEVSAERRLIATEARIYRRTLRTGTALGRIVIPRLGLNIILVTGTDHDSLMKGPGWYTGSKLPGEGQLIYIAGHRTTYLAPFAHIDALRPGDKVTIELPYATFIYEIRGHKIVTADDLSRLRSHNREVLALQACHPRFFATHRYIAYGVPIRVIPRKMLGPPYAVPLEQLPPGTIA
jgi:sortase A